MAQMAFSEDLLVGFGQMDEIHEDFVEKYNALEAANPESDLAHFLKCYDDFIAHLDHHFSAENTWMEVVQFPECHKAEHDRVLAVVRDVRIRAEKGDLAIAGRLIKELPLWLDNHAKSMDTALAQFLLSVEFDPVTQTAKVEGVVPQEGSCSC